MDFYINFTLTFLAKGEKILKVRNKSLALLFVIIVLTSCVYEKDVDDGNHSNRSISGLTLLTTDSVWVANDSTFRLIAVHVQGNTLADSVALIFLNYSTNVRILLKDDGGLTSVENSNYFWLSNNSGDVVPNDNIWCCRIAIGLLPIQNLDIQFLAYFSSQSISMNKNWLIVNNRSPIIASIIYPDSIYSGSDTSIFVSTFDPDTLILSGIRSVVANIFQLPNRTYFGLRDFQAISGNQTWKMHIPYTFASGKQTGTYRFVITSTDLLNSSTSDSISLWIENQPPYCDSIILSGNTVVGQTLVYFDSTASDTVIFKFDVSWEDPQSTTDIRSMHLELYRDLLGDSAFWDTLLFEGTGFDTVALDGKLMVPFQLDNRNRPTHPNYRRPPFDHYRIKFKAFDGGNNTSNDTTYHFYIVQPTSKVTFKKSQISFRNSKHKHPINFLVQD